MQIIVNDFLTSPLKLSRGVRQGDALSPMLYVLCVEVLACTFRNSSQIEGFLLPGAAGAQFKVSQYADDATVLSRMSPPWFNFLKLFRCMRKDQGLG